MVEHELLCLLARTGLSARAATRVGTLVKGRPNWDGLMEAATAHRVLPLVYRQLKALGLEEVPGPVFAWAREAFLLNAAGNLRFAAQLKELVGLLEEEGVPAVPFKGPVLAQEVFGDVALRQFTDLDILVPGKAAWRAVEVLKGAGFRPEISLSASQFRRYAMRNKSLSFGGAERGVPLDLHWDLSGDYTAAAMTYEALEPGFERVELLGAPLVTLGDRDLLIYLCLHAAMESWSRLDHVCCVAELMRRNPDLAGMETLKRAGVLHSRRCLLAGCSLAHGLLEADVPGWLLGMIERDRHVKAYAGQCMGRLFEGRAGAYGNGKRPKFGGAHFLLKDRGVDKLRHLLFLAVSPTVEDWRRLPVPGALGFVLYGYRPLRLGLEAFRRRGGRVRHGCSGALVRCCSFTEEKAKPGRPEGFSGGCDPSRLAVWGVSTLREASPGASETGEAHRRHGSPHRCPRPFS